MNRPVAGPQDPFNNQKNRGMNSISGQYPSWGHSGGEENVLTNVGHVEEQAMDAYSFMVQQRTFDVHGYAVNPSTASANGLVGSAADASQNGYAPIDAIRPSKSSKREQKRKRAGKGDAGVVDGDEAYMGPWAAYESTKVEEVIEDDPEADEEWREEKRRRDEAKEAALAKVKEAKVEKSIFHGESSDEFRLYVKLTTSQERNSWITLGERICTFQQIRTSSSTRPMARHHQTHICPSGVYIPG